MNEVNVIKQYLNEGRMVWFQGPLGVRKVRIAYELLRRCNVLEFQIIQLSAFQFIDFIEKGMMRDVLLKYQVLMIKELESLERGQLHRFLNALNTYESFKKKLYFKVVLVSTGSFKGMGLIKKELNIIVVKIKGIGEDPSDLNERIHNLIELASKLSAKKVIKISESIAVFIENMSWKQNDEELLDLFLMAICRMKGNCLRIEHVFPNRHSNKFKTGEVVMM